MGGKGLALRLHAALDVEHIGQDRVDVFLVEMPLGAETKAAVVLIGVMEENAGGWLFVASRAPCFLGIGFEGGRGPGMEHEAHPRAVDAHAKGDGRDDDLKAPLGKVALDARLVLRGCVRRGRTRRCGRGRRRLEAICSVSFRL